MIEFFVGERVYVRGIQQYGVIEATWSRTYWNELQPPDYWYTVKLDRWGYANVFQEKLKSAQTMH